MSYFNCVWRRRQTVLLGAVALVCTPLFCQSQTPLNSMLRVVLQPTGDERGTVEARITNQSGKSISAFTIKLSMVNADRTVTTSLENLGLQTNTNTSDRLRTAASCTGLSESERQERAQTLSRSSLMTIQSPGTRTGLNSTSIITRRRRRN